MEVGRQFDDSATQSLLKAYDNAGNHSVSVAQLCVDYRDFVGLHADPHRLSGQIPRVVGLYGDGIGAVCQHDSGYE